MVSKIIEIRDSGTFIPALAIRLGSPNEAERYLLARSGFGRTMEDQSEYIVLCKINGNYIHDYLRLLYKFLRYVLDYLRVVMYH